ncbi:putative defensin-like protein [Helianthus anomalus]
MLFGLLLIITTSAQAGGENDLKINIDICDHYVNWPAPPDCENDWCTWTCKDLHGKRAWGSCINATMCHCQYFCA